MHTFHWELLTKDAKQRAKIKELLFLIIKKNASYGKAFLHFGV